jgi:PmbA protein
MEGSGPVTDIRDLAKTSLEWMIQQSSAIQTEIYIRRSQERIVKRRDQKLVGVDHSESFGSAVRVLHDGRVGFACSAGAEVGGLRELWLAASAQLPHLAPQPARVFPVQSEVSEDHDFSHSIYDDDILCRPWQAIEQRLASCETDIVSPARVMRSELSEMSNEKMIASTTGVLAFERESSVAISVTCAAGEGEDMQMSEAVRSSRRLDSVDFAAAIREASRRAKATIGAGRVRAGRRSVILEPWIGAEFLELLAEVLSAQEVYGGRSLLSGRLGKKVASEVVTLRDDPRLPGTVGSVLFDDEGVVTRNKTLIDRGVLRDYFYDSASASRADIRTNGCAYRTSWNALPAPGPANLYFAPGDVSREKIIQTTTDGVLIMEMLGAHTIDPISGEFSVGVSGYEIEQGQLARPFKGAMISGNLLQLLNDIDGVADDLVAYQGLGAPTIRISRLDVA